MRNKRMVLSCSVEWDEPYGGECTDVFVLGDGGYSLTQLSDMTIRSSGRRCKYRCVSGAGRARLGFNLYPECATTSMYA